MKVYPVLLETWYIGKLEMLIGSYSVAGLDG